MLRIANLNVPLGHTGDEPLQKALEKLRAPRQEVLFWRVSKKSVDARDKADVHFVMAVDVKLRHEQDILKKAKNGVCTPVAETPELLYPAFPARTLRPVVAGFGPGGLFAALALARAGLRPIVLERGQSVDKRARTVEAFFSGGSLDPETNIQFGEGGAGAFSDGKLTTGIKDRRCAQVLKELHAHGAPEEILYLAHPHIGTDNLPRVVENIRKEILSLGGEVRFETRLTGIETRHGAICSVRTESVRGTEQIPTDAIIAAIGHSAADTQQMLFMAGVNMIQKPFSVGVRIEHKQALINRSQYGAFARHPALSAAEYHLSAKLPDGRGVYTFCMCPGGTVVAAASRTGGVCTNGMSRFARDGENANAALLVDVRPEDFGDTHPLAGYTLQRAWESRAFAAGGENYHAPAQLVGDLMENRATTRLGEVTPTYRPGVTGADLRAVLPDFAYNGIREGIRMFDRQLKGFASHDAVLTGVESRSSCPVRVPRDEHGESNIRGLYPCGEGAGYAGGIMSAAVDGLRAAEAVMEGYRNAVCGTEGI